MPYSTLITGISSGIGLALAESYLAAGATVFGLSRRSPPVRHPNLHFVQADLAELDSIPTHLKQLLPGVNHLDLVLLNAAILGQIADLSETTIAEIEHVMRVNVWSNKVVLDTLFAADIAVAQVVAISSGASVSPARGWNAYAISKAALNTMMSLYAAERPATHFCALAPGIVDTPMQAQLSEHPDDERFPSLALLKAARGTPRMPQPDAAAPRLMAAIRTAREMPSGSFLDVRTLTIGRVTSAAPQ